MTTRWSWRAALAGFAGGAGGIVFRVAAPTEVVATWLPFVALLVGVGVAFGRSLGAQLLARALWWANLFLGAILCVLGSRHEHASGVALVVGCAVALLVADRRRCSRRRRASPRGPRPTRDRSSCS